MNNRVFTTTLLALALLLPLAACSQPGADADNGKAQTTQENSVDDSMIAAHIRKSIQEAKRKLATENIDVSSVRVGDERRAGRDDLPKAEITPQGDLLIAGRKVEATPGQHALLLDYRGQIIGIAKAGMDIGMSSAGLGVSAAKEALWGAFTGKSDAEIEAAVKPQTDKIKTAALRLCTRLPDLLASQQKLAAAMPEFRPYANMTQEDIDDCGKDITDENGKGGFALFSG